MADEDFVDFDQEWFFDELKGEQTEGTTLDPPLPPSPPPAASSSITNHGSTNQSHPQIQQHIQQPSNQSNVYQDQQMGHRDGIMPSTSTYGMPQQHQPLQEQQQIPVSQHQQHQMPQVQQQSQQQFETLQTYNPNQQNQNIQNHYQQNSQQIVFDMEMEFMQNEASTSSAMPMECRISQEYNQTQQYQQPPQQQQQGDNQWMPMEQSSQMSQQHAQHMTSIVYTSTSQQMPRIPDPGGHHTNQPQIINNYNSQQIISTGINGQPILANMQPVQHLQPQQQQQSQQQQFELNSNYIQPQIAYIDPTGSQQFITQGEAGNLINFHQPVMQVIPQIVPIQSAPPATETPAPAPAPPATKSKAKNTSRANGRKKNQPPPQPKSQAPTEGDSILSKIGAFGSVAVNFDPEKAARMAELMGKMAALGANEEQGFNMAEERANLERQLEELLSGANIIPQPTPNPTPAKPTPAYTPIAPNSTPTPQPKNKKARTKAEKQQEMQQKKAANAGAANVNSNVNMNMQPVPQVIQQQQQTIPSNESGYRIISQDVNFLIVESNGTYMKAVNVRTENGTATYQILGPVDEKTLYQLKQQQQQQQPPPQQPPPSQPQQQKRVQQQSAFKGNENDEAAPAAVIDVVNSLSSSSKAKPQKKTPARSRSKKAPEPPQPPAIVEQKPVKIEKEIVKPEPTPTVICVPSASKEPPKPKIVFPSIAVSAKRVKDKTDSRKRRIAEWIKKLKEAIATTDINSPFIDKEDVFNRLMPYGFHYEPNISQKTMEKFEHELIRHQTHLYDRYKSIEGKMQQIFIRDTTKQNFDLEKNMLLAIDAEYEKQQLEKDKALFQSDPYQFILQSDVIKSSSLNDEYITETRRLLNLNKPKNLKPTKGFHFEPSHFDETEFIKRKLNLIKEDEEREKEEKLAAFKKAHPPPPVHKPPPKPTPPPIQTPKLPPKPSIEPVKINIKIQENITPNKEVSKPKKPVEFTSSSESSSSDDDYAKSSKTSKSKKAKSFRSSSSQKERKSKSPQKSKHADLAVQKDKSNHTSADKFNNKHQPPIKVPIRKQQPPPNPFIAKMDLGNYKIPKLGESSQSVSSKVLPIKQEPFQKEQPKFIEPKPKEFLKPSEPPKIKENIIPIKIKENVIETIKIKKSSLSHSLDNISSHKEKKKEKQHHHHHHHHHSSSSKNGERSNSVISNHSTSSSTHKSSKTDERSESLNPKTSKVPSLVIKPFSQFKNPNEIKKEEMRSKEIEKSSSKHRESKDTVKAEEKPLKTRIEIPKPEVSEQLVQQPLKLKINFGSKKPADSPSTSNSIKESIPSSNNLIVEQQKKKDKKDKHSKESQKEKKMAEEAPPVLEQIEEKINHIDKAEEDDEAAKEAKRKRKEEKKRQKAEKKEQRKLEKKQRKEEQKEDDGNVKATLQTFPSPGGDHLKLKLSFKKPIKPVEEVTIAPLQHLSSPPPLLKPEFVPIEATPKLKLTFSRNILPESSKKPKKEKDRNLKRESPKVETEPNLDAPPLKIPRVKIKIGAPQNQITASSSSSISAFAAPVAPIISPLSTLIVEKKKSVVEKQIENSENTASSPLQLHPQIERPSMVGQPPNATMENVTAPLPKIRRIKKSKHGGSGFSDCSDVEETQVDLRLMTDRILSRCRD